MRILITACNGQLGVDASDFFRKKCEVIAYKDVDLDITDSEKVFFVVDKVKPDIILNCAAITNVDGCETNKELAFRVNAYGAGTVAKAAESVRASLIHISTDYVFDGNKLEEYTEEDDPNPINVYGQSKREAELLVSEYCKKAYILRTAWLYGPSGNNFVKKMIELGKQKEQVSVVTDQVGSPTSTFELLRIIDAVVRTGQYGIFNSTCSGYCSRNEFTKEIYKYAGIKTKVNDVTSEQFKRPARIPKNSKLSKGKLIQLSGYRPMDWRLALKEYFDYINH